MKGKQKANLASLSLQELKKQLHEVTEKKFSLKFKHAVSPVANPMEIRALRKEIAVLKTLINQKERAAAK